MSKQNNLPSYDAFLELKKREYRSFEENKHLGTLTKQTVIQALYLFIFLDKKRLMNLLDQEPKNQGSFYRIIKTLLAEKVIKTVPSLYTESKQVYALKPKAFRTYLEPDLIENYQFNQNKMGLGVSATHNLKVRSVCIAFLQNNPSARIITEKRIRVLIKTGQMNLYRIPDAIFVDDGLYFFIEFEFSNKNRKDRREALIKADMNCRAYQEKYPDAEITTIWYLNTPGMLKLFEEEIFHLVHYKTEVTRRGRLAERGISPHLQYQMYSIKNNNHILGELS